MNSSVKTDSSYLFQFLYLLHTFKEIRYYGFLDNDCDLKICIRYFGITMEFMASGNCTMMETGDSGEPLCGL